MSDVLDDVSSHIFKATIKILSSAVHITNPYVYNVFICCIKFLERIAEMCLSYYLATPATSTAMIQIDAHQNESTDCLILEDRRQIMSNALWDTAAKTDDSTVKFFFLLQMSRYQLQWMYEQEAQGAYNFNTQYCD